MWFTSGARKRVSSHTLMQSTAGLYPIGYLTEMSFLSDHCIWRNPAFYLGIVWTPFSSCLHALKQDLTWHGWTSIFKWSFLIFSPVQSVISDTDNRESASSLAGTALITVWICFYVFIASIKLLKLLFLSFYIIITARLDCSYKREVETTGSLTVRNVAHHNNNIVVFCRNQYILIEKNII